MKTYRRHGCTRTHRTYRALAKCMVPRAAWVTGEGPYALIASCRVPTITLSKDLAAAHERLRWLDDDACGGRCTGRHEVVLLAPERNPR